MKTTILVVTMLLLLAGCKDSQVKPEVAAGTTSVATPAGKASADPEDPCRLLEPKEVEAALGAPLVVPPYRGGQAIGDRAAIPDATGSACWYFTAEGKNLTVKAEWKNAGAIMAGVGGYLAKAEKAAGGMLKLQDGTELTGDWDEVRVLGCCDFMALQGDSMVEIDFGGSLNTTAAQAGQLANKALARLTKPLAIDGSAELKPALKRILSRYVSTDPCSLWTDADITALIGAPKGAPERSDNTCTRTYTNKQGRDIMFMTMVTLSNGYRSFRRDNSSFAAVTTSINAIGDASTRLKDAKSIEGPWEAAVESPIMFNTVSKDAQIAVRQRGMSPEELAALIGHGYAKIQAGAKK
jgi:hypothetical protein